MMASGSRSRNIVVSRAHSTSVQVSTAAIPRRCLIGTSKPSFGCGPSFTGGGFGGVSAGVGVAGLEVEVGEWTAAAASLQRTAAAVSLHGTTPEASEKDDNIKDSESATLSDAVISVRCTKPAVAPPTSTATGHGRTLERPWPTTTVTAPLHQQASEAVPIVSVDQNMHASLYDGIVDDRKRVGTYVSYIDAYASSWGEAWGGGGVQGSVEPVEVVEAGLDITAIAPVTERAIARERSL